MVKSTKKCRQGCDVYKDWLKMEAAEAHLILDIVRLKAKITAVKKGIIPMPEFGSIGKMSFIGELDTPEKAYIFGWTTCEFEYGELVSKPMESGG